MAVAGDRVPLLFDEETRTLDTYRELVDSLAE
jgi:hypothetical protein